MLRGGRRRGVGEEGNIFWKRPEHKLGWATISGGGAGKSLAFPISFTFTLIIILSHQSLLFCICLT
jgi:hypothetical protein